MNLCCAILFAALWRLNGGRENLAAGYLPEPGSGRSEGAVPVLLGAAGWPADRMVPLRTVVQGLSSRSIPGARNVIADSPDPWGNQYLIVVGGAAPGMSVAVICAGPDGIIETPFGIVATRGGDDIMSVR